MLAAMVDNAAVGVTAARFMPDSFRAVHHAVVLRAYPGRHEWKVWRAGFEECLRLSVPAGR